MFKEKLAIIIPTKDRPNELKLLLESIAKQEVKPAQIIIVDGGSNDSKDILNSSINLNNIDYIKKNPPSLTLQRNIGINMLKEEASLVAFFDDDIILKPGCLNNMMRFWERASSAVGGAGFNITGEIYKYKRPSLFAKIFLVDADNPSMILRSGFQSKVYFCDETKSAEWLVGCAMVWRKNIFKAFMFDEWFSGYARYEDVDFSYRVGKKYKMYIIADAHVQHFIKPERIEFSSALGKMEVVNRLYFVRKNQLSIPLCYWALSGLLLNNVVKAILGVDIRYIYRVKGNLLGFIHIILEMMPNRIKGK